MGRNLAESASCNCQNDESKFGRTSDKECFQKWLLEMRVISFGLLVSLASCKTCLALISEKGSLSLAFTPSATLRENWHPTVPKNWEIRDEHMAMLRFQIIPRRRYKKIDCYALFCSLSNRSLRMPTPSLDITWSLAIPVSNGNRKAGREPSENPSFPWLHPPIAPKAPHSKRDDAFKENAGARSRKKGRKTPLQMQESWKKTLWKHLSPPFFPETLGVSFSARNPHCVV